MNSTSGGLSFKMAGIPVNILPASFVIVGLIGLLAAAGGGLILGLWIAIILFISIFLHECGHAFMAKALGVPVLELQLNGMGGYVRHAGGLDNIRAFLITLAGPLVNLALMVFANFMSAATAQELGNGMISQSYVWFFLSRINFMLLVMNLLPVIPLDGGMLLHRFLMMFYSTSKGGKIVPVKRWKYTPDQIVGGVGVVFSVLWIPLAILLFLYVGFLPLFIPPYQFNLALWRGQARIGA